jgi:hypothetical protein
VCDGSASRAGNEILLCDGCDLSAHQACYGVQQVPSGDWFCEGCRAGGAVGADGEACWEPPWYTASDGEKMSAIAARLGCPIARLLRLNSDAFAGYVSAAVRQCDRVCGSAAARFRPRPNPPAPPSRPPSR